MNFPQRIVVELTTRCNLSCPMCPRHYAKMKNGYMSKELWKKLIDEISEVSPDSIIIPFWRGESLLHPDFVRLMEYALDRSLRIHISTNGHTVSKEQAKVLARCEFVTFSVHTPAGYIHAKEFLKLKKSGKPIVQISFVKGESTTEAFLKDLISIPDIGQFNSVRLYEEHSIDGVFGKSSISSEGPRIYCPKLTDTLVIAFDGTISRCNHVWETEKTINLNSIGIRSAWNSPRLEEIRNGYPDKLCSPCDQWTGHTCGESWRVIEGKVEHMTYGEVME